jgi:hypothetical protein
VNPRYGGWQTTGNYQGVNGYVYQALTGSTTGMHASWINLCAYNDCAHWVQLGTYQGTMTAGVNPSAVHVYYENVDACGDYYVDDRGAPSSANQLYWLYRYSSSSYQQTCNNGSHHTAWDFAFKMGPLVVNPFHYGTLPTSTGLALAKTELQNSPPENTDYFGCDSSHTCGSSSGYGMKLMSGGSWSTWTASSVHSNAQPPFLHTYKN